MIKYKEIDPGAVDAFVLGVAIRTAKMAVLEVPWGWVKRVPDIRFFLPLTWRPEVPAIGHFEEEKDIFGQTRGWRGAWASRSACLPVSLPRQ